MKKEIACYVNDDGKTTVVQENGRVILYGKKEAGWVVVKEIPFEIDQLKGIRNIRESFKDLAKKLGDCKIFVAKKITGLVYTVFETEGFNLWEIEGEPLEFIDEVLEKEESFELAKEENQALLERLAPKRKDQEGHYTVDLIEVQQQPDGITSKQVLLPFLKEGKFYELEVICRHIPKWFDKQLSQMGYTKEVFEQENGVYLVKIRKTLCDEKTV